MPCGRFAALRIGRGLYGENRFFFCGKSGMFLSYSWFFACPAGACILRVKPLFLLWEKWDIFILQLVFLPARLGIVFPLAQRGPKPLFLLLAKEKAVLDSEKEKIDRWRLWGGTIQPDVGFVLLWGPSGKRR